MGNWSLSLKHSTLNLHYVPINGKTAGLFNTWPSVTSSCLPVKSLNSHFHPILLFIPAILNCHLILLLQQHTLSRILALLDTVQQVSLLPLLLHFTYQKSTKSFNTQLRCHLFQITLGWTKWPLLWALVPCVHKNYLSTKPYPKGICLSFSFSKSGTVHPQVPIHSELSANVYWAE